MKRNIGTNFDVFANQSFGVAHILGKMTLVKNGKLVATGVHDKANIDPPTAMSIQDSKL